MRKRIRGRGLFSADELFNGGLGWLILYESVVIGLSRTGEFVYTNVMRDARAQ